MVVFRLGRVSNLPPVWTSCIAGALLSGNFLFDQRIFLLIVAMSLLYIAGMFLNDAFDHVFDTKERPYRPIPSGQASVFSVAIWGGLLMLLGLLILFLSPDLPTEKDKVIISLNKNISAICLCLLILLYNWKHKGNPLSPYIMGMCRGMLCITAGSMYSSVLNIELMFGATIIFLWAIGLTFLAKQETLDRVDKYWPILFLVTPIFYGIAIAEVSSSYVVCILLILITLVIVSTIYILRSDKPGRVGLVVSILIASFSLLDGLLIAISGFEILAVFVAMTMVLTLILQKHVPGT